MKTLAAVAPGVVRDTFLTPENINLLRQYGEVVFVDEMKEAAVAETIGDADVYLTCWGSPRLSAAILEKAPRLRLLSHMAGTVVPVVSEALWQRGVRVISANACLAESTAEGAFAYILAAQRDIPAFSRAFSVEKRWKSAEAVNYSLLGKTVGVVSYGVVARNIIRYLQPFGVRILIYDIVPIPEEDKKKYGMEQVSLETLFSTADIITVHTPLNPATEHMIGKELFDLIRPDALFVNTARGGVLDQAALEQALVEGRFRAALDVFEKEPPAPDCPLYGLPNVLMMPHMAGPTLDFRAHMAEAIIRESADFIDRGLPLSHEITAAHAAAMTIR